MEVLNYNSIIYKVLGRASVEIEEFFTLIWQRYAL